MAFSQELFSLLIAHMLIIGRDRSGDMELPLLVYILIVEISPSFLSNQSLIVNYSCLQFIESSVHALIFLSFFHFLVGSLGLKICLEFQKEKRKLRNVRRLCEGVERRRKRRAG